MKPSFPRLHGKTRRRHHLTSIRSLTVALAFFATFPPASFAQAPAAAKAAAPIITQVAFTMPTELEDALKDFHSGAQALVGSPADSPKAATFADKVAAHLRQNGYPFANAVSSADSAKPGKMNVSVSPGKIGVGNVDGNAWLSEEGILDSLG